MELLLEVSKICGQDFYEQNLFPDVQHAYKACNQQTDWAEKANYSECLSLISDSPHYGVSYVGSSQYAYKSCNYLTDWAEKANYSECISLISDSPHYGVSYLGGYITDRTGS